MTSRFGFLHGLLLGILAGGGLTYVLTANHVLQNETPSSPGAAASLADLEGRASSTIPASASSAQGTPKPFDFDLPEKPKGKIPSKGASSAAMASFYADQHITGIEKYVALTDDEKEKLKEKLEADAKKNPDNAFDAGDRALQIVKDVIGDDRAKAWKEGQEAEEARRSQEIIDQAAFTLTRKLSLEPAQEAHVRDVLQQIQEESKPFALQLSAKMKEIVARHGDNNPEAMQKNFEEMRAMMKTVKEKRRTLLNDKLRPVLTDDQYNTLLEGQAADQNALFGMRDF